MTLSKMTQSIITILNATLYKEAIALQLKDTKHNNNNKCHTLHSG
jgi:hypothetical protein